MKLITTNAIGDDGCDALDEEDVALGDREGERRAQPLDVEDHLDDHGAGDEVAEVEADGGEQVQARGPEGMADQDPGGRHALGLGHADEVLLERGDHVGAQEPDVDRDETERECERR